MLYFYHDELRNYLAEFHDFLNVCFACVPETGKSNHARLPMQARERDANEVDKKRKRNNMKTT